MRTTIEQLVGSADYALTTRTASASRLRSGCFLACHEDCGWPCDRGCSLRDRRACGWAHYSGDGLIARTKKPRPCRPSSATGTRLCTSRLPTTTSRKRNGAFVCCAEFRLVSQRWWPLYAGWQREVEDMARLTRFGR